jgi:hypothetical protein
LYFQFHPWFFNNRFYDFSFAHFVFILFAENAFRHEANAPARLSEMSEFELYELPKIWSDRFGESFKRHCERSEAIYEAFQGIASSLSASQ